MKQLVTVLGLLALVAISMSCGCTQGSCDNRGSATVTSKGGTGGDCGGGEATPPATTADAGGQRQGHGGG
jgi:hypothetical protein